MLTPDMQENCFKYFNIVEYHGFLINVLITPIDKANEKDLIKREK